VFWVFVIAATQEVVPGDGFATIRQAALTKLLRHVVLGLEEVCEG
jgi:hypothetical protein